MMRLHFQSRDHTFFPKCTSTNFPKRLLLLLRTVFAFPNDSRIGLAAIRHSILHSTPGYLSGLCSHAYNPPSFGLEFLHPQVKSKSYSSLVSLQSEGIINANSCDRQSLCMCYTNGRCPCRTVSW